MFFFMNSFSYNGMTSRIFGGKPGTIDVKGVSKTKYVSFGGLKVKDLTKRNATKVDRLDWSMVNPKTRPLSLKARMTHDENKKNPKIVSDNGFGRMVKDKFVFRQKFPIRSYEIGPNRKVSIETLMNHMQETSINHINAIGLLEDGFGLTPEMCKKNLIWVMANIQLAVDRYPIWGDVVQIDTWKSASRKTGMCTNWIFSDGETGEILIRASCILVLMNKETRRLSKFPKEVRAEFQQYFIDTPPIIKQDSRKWSKTDKNIVDHVCNGLTPRCSDLDINQHVSNVKYVGWILESIPKTILDNYELASMTLEYRRECKKDDILRSQTHVNDGELIDHVNEINCEHLLQLEIGGDGEEIMRGRTSWRSKYEKD